MALRPDDLTPAKYRTWGQWRGYPKVRTFTGGPSEGWGATEAIYMRGMNGDCLTVTATGTCATSRSAKTISDTRAAQLFDEDLDQGFVRATRTYDGATVTFNGLHVSASTPAGSSQTRSAPRC